MEQETKKTFTINHIPRRNDFTRVYKGRIVYCSAWNSFNVRGESVICDELYSDYNISFRLKVRRK